MWPAGGHGVGTVSGSLACCFDAPSYSRGDSPEDFPFEADDYAVPAFVRRLASVDEQFMPPSPVDVSAFWVLLKQDSTHIISLLVAMPDALRDELLGIATHSGLELEEVATIFFVRLFDRMDPVQYSKQLARQLRVQFNKMRVPFEFDREKLEMSIQRTINELLKQKP